MQLMYCSWNQFLWLSGCHWSSNDAPAWLQMNWFMEIIVDCNYLWICLQESYCASSGALSRKLPSSIVFGRYLLQTACATYVPFVIVIEHSFSHRWVLLPCSCMCDPRTKWIHRNLFLCWFERLCFVPSYRLAAFHTVYDVDLKLSNACFISLVFWWWNCGISY